MTATITRIERYHARVEANVEAMLDERMSMAEFNRRQALLWDEIHSAGRIVIDGVLDRIRAGQQLQAYGARADHIFEATEGRR